MKLNPHGNIFIFSKEQKAFSKLLKNKQRIKISFGMLSSFNVYSKQNL